MQKFSAQMDNLYSKTCLLRTRLYQIHAYNELEFIPWQRLYYRICNW